MHYLGADGNGRCTGDAFKLADDKQIRHSVKCLKKIRKKIGQRKNQNVFEYAARGEIFFHNKFLLLLKNISPV